ncbi:CAP domain-containing protein [Deinococcus sp. S9]|uniref:CAP domain-containing protein n=1 Tax=Deinococcus sp. S9 TaxID=2545754 RepID=UPI001404BC8D|nr:CAP domain-containing protein [Deinococcus sp. S9]
MANQLSPLRPAALLSTVLASCGGTTPSTVYTPAPTFTPVRSAMAPDTFDAPEVQALAAINAARAQGITCTTAQGTKTASPPAPALSLEGHLQRAAEWHAQDMHTRGYIAHEAPSPAPHGIEPIDRVMNAGYRPERGLENGENLATGYSDPVAVVQAWLESTHGHCETLANATYVDIGIAKVGEAWALEAATPL